MPMPALHQKTELPNLPSSPADARAPAQLRLRWCWTIKLFICSTPPRRFAPPLLSRGGELFPKPRFFVQICNDRLRATHYPTNRFQIQPSRVRLSRLTHSVGGFIVA